MTREEQEDHNVSLYHREGCFLKAYAYLVLHSDALQTDDHENAPLSGSQRLSGARGLVERGPCVDYSYTNTLYATHSTL